MMIIYGLSGKSGTGKSYHSQELCAKLGIDALIDDGLLICDNVIIAGHSAKKEATKIGAVKCAIFTDDAHCREMKDAINNCGKQSFLIVGTSDEMILKISNRLELPDPIRIVHIEEITTYAERRIAKHQRRDNGMHVIPAPTFEVRKQFSGYFLDPKKGFKDLQNVPVPTEKTVMRPTYSYLGNFEISSKVISDIVKHVASEIEGISSVLWVASDNDDAGMFIRVILLFTRDAKVRRAAAELQKKVAETVAYMTAFNILGVDVEVHGFKA